MWFCVFPVQVQKETQLTGDRMNTLKRFITTEELSEFKDKNNIVLGLVDTPIGEVYAVVSGHHNQNDPYECMCLKELLEVANGA